MPDKFYPPTLEQTLRNILRDLNNKGEIFNIPEQLFYKPWHHHYLYTKKFNQQLHNPLGLAAGPHTQLAQNIVAGWLCGARYIELKTIQENDRIEVSKPCIDMHNEGYNCEWSQELTVEQSYDQYLDAWILIHILNHRLFSKKKKNLDVGTIFNMSVGYSLRDVRGEKVQWFIDKMLDCSKEKKEKIKQILPLYPDIDKIDIPDQISDSVTLSTMHGCQPREIEYIAKFLMIEKKLHTVIKFNPTLLGSGSVRAILNKSRGYDIEIPDSTFDEDINYIDAIRLIDTVGKTAREMDLHIGIKISNTLEVINKNTQLPASEQKVYMSGIALHPIAVNLAAKLEDRFEGLMDISFSGGADCFNIVNLIKCSFSTITMCSDLLKPGGYARLHQYFEQLSKAFANLQAKNINQFILKSSSEFNVKTAALEHLKDYAIHTLNDKTYQKDRFMPADIKTNRPLNHFDCITAPCIDQCPTLQDIPDYLWHTKKDNLEHAFRSVFKNNPFPSVTGMICDHPCQLKCTRMNYDEPILIREIKRYVAENSPVNPDNGKRIRRIGKKVAVIGGGPAGMSCAWYLNLSGFYVDVYETDEQTGGMVSGAIPDFRITNAAVLKDIERIKKTGIKVYKNTPVDKDKFKEIYRKYHYIFIGTGAQKSCEADFIGEKVPGIIDPIEFLQQAKKKADIHLGKNVVVIGGGNTAMDAARTAFRLVGEEGSVSLIYRRTVNEMPADKGEVQAVLEEEINLLEMMTPKKILTKAGRVSGMECVMTRLERKDKSGRPKPVEIEGSEFTLAFDTVIPAIGQELDIDFIDLKKLKTKKGSYETQDKKIFIGGDALRGASTAIKAIGDGRKAAAEIAEREEIILEQQLPNRATQVDMQELKLKKLKREHAVSIDKLPAEKRQNFNMVIPTLDKKKAIKEASRCLQCDLICSVCVSVCPNHAMVQYTVNPNELLVPTVYYSYDDFSVEYEHHPGITQKYQVLNLADWCNECGNCTIFCPTAGKPFLDKPRVFFNRESFGKSPEGFLLRHTENHDNLTMKNNGQLATLTESWDAYIFENDDCMAVLDKETFEITQIDIFTDEEGSISLPEIAEMKMIYLTVKNLI